MLYRLKQFIWALTAKISEEERTFIRDYLSPSELDLFVQLKTYEQKHCLCVARLMAEKTTVDQQNYIRLGLLHDIGKIKYPLNPVEKGMIVVLDKLTKGKIRNNRKLKMVRCYYDHASIGYELLKGQAGYEESFLNAIRDHHQAQPNTSQLVNDLQECDNRS